MFLQAFNFKCRNIITGSLTQFGNTDFDDLHLSKAWVLAFGTQEKMDELNKIKNYFMSKNMSLLSAHFDTQFGITKVYCARL